MWQMAAMGLDLIGSIGQYQVQKAQYKAQQTIDAANVNASNLLRQGENEKAAARLSLSTYAQSLNNRRAARAGDEQITALSQNFGRMLDASTRGSIQQQLAASEQVGKIAAAAAFAGVGGASTEKVEGTLRLRQALMEGEQDRQIADATADFHTQRSQIERAKAEGLDYRYQLAGMNYGQDVMPFRAKPSATAMAFDFLSRNAGNIANAANAFGKPSAPGATNTNSQSAVTPVTSPSFGSAVSNDFFQVGGPGGIGVNWQI